MWLKVDELNIAEAKSDVRVVIVTISPPILFETLCLSVVERVPTYIPDFRQF